MKLNRLRLLAADMDGTTLDSRAKVKPSALGALKAWMEAGGIVVPASGRTLDAIPQEVLDLGMEYAVTANGATVVDIHSGRYLYENGIGIERGLELLHYLLTENGQSYFQYREAYYEDGNRVEEMERTHPYILGSGLRREHKLSEPFSYLAGLQGMVQKFGFMAFDRETALRVAAHCRTIPGFCVLQTGPMDIEITKEGVSKGRALKYLCSQLHIGQEQVMAIGDSANDLEMLKFAGTGVAMGNATAEVKRISDFITRTNDEDGVEWAVRTYGSL